MAGGPFWCARGNLKWGEEACMSTPSLIGVDELIAITYTTYETTRTISDPSNMKNDRVYVFSGLNDSVVKTGVVDATWKYYKHFVTEGTITTEFSIPAEHALVTLDYGNACGYLGIPYINKCGFDGAGAMLKNIVSFPLKPRSSSFNESNFFIFDQTEFLKDLPGKAADYGMDESGFVYVPLACQNKDTNTITQQQQQHCYLHVHYHGCKQSTEVLGQTYIQHSGFANYADSNNLIILFPQAHSSLLNPYGCWDWIGWYGETYASRLGLQIIAVKEMIDRLDGTNLNLAGTI